MRLLSLLIDLLHLSSLNLTDRPCSPEDTATSIPPMVMAYAAPVADSGTEAAVKTGVDVNGHAQEEMSWVVNKFGGTSVASAEAMGRVQDIVMGQVSR